MSHNDYINTKQLGKRIKESREMLTDEDGKKVTQEALANILDFSAHIYSMLREADEPHDCLIS